MSLYSDAELKAFVDKTVIGIGSISVFEEKSVKQDVVQTLKRVPDWQQLLLIEPGYYSVFGTYEKINETYSSFGITSPSASAEVNGFLQPSIRGLTQRDIEDERNIRIDNPAHVNFWSIEGRGIRGSVTRLHEEGHRADAFLSRRLERSSLFYTTGDEQWNRALQLEYSRQQSRNATFTTFFNRASGGVKVYDQIEVLPETLPKSLYRGYRHLNEHLAAYTTDTHAAESFAEMFNHQTNLHVLFDGNEEKVDSLLQDRFPYLWPVYRDEIVPKIQRQVETLAHDRRNAIDRYVSLAQSWQKINGLPRQDEAHLKEVAGVKRINRKLDTETEQMERSLHEVRSVIQRQSAGTYFNMGLASG